MKSGDVSRARINPAAPGAFEAARAASTGGTTRTSASPAIVASRSNPRPVGQRPERARLRHAYRPVRIRVEARERGGEGFGIDARQRAHRRAANGGGAVGHELHEDVGRAGIGQRRQRGHRLEPYRGIRARVADDPGDERQRRAIAQGGERAERLDHQRAVTRLLHQCANRGHRLAWPWPRPGPAPRTTPCSAPGVERSVSRTGAARASPARCKRIGNRPPARHRLAVRADHRGGDRLVDRQARQGEESKADGLDRRRER